MLMNMFFGSRIKGMPAKLVSDDGKNVVIRPLAYVAETDLEKWAQHRQFPIIPCTLCGSQTTLQRVQVKSMIREWERKYPGRIDNMFTAMGNITLSHMMDRKLFPFTTIQANGQADVDGDIAFDEEPCAPVSPSGVVQWHHQEGAELED
jgi:tRNA 2-thiocytidine biosynthesis protein TtcA